MQRVPADAASRVPGTWGMEWLGTWFSRGFPAFLGSVGEQRCPQGMLLDPVQYMEHGGELLGCV